jgi:hypothetical protein
MQARGSDLKNKDEPARASAAPHGLAGIIVTFVKARPSITILSVAVF